MNDIKKVVKQLIKEGKQIEITAKVKEMGKTGEYYLPDKELKKLWKKYPEYLRAGTESQVIKGKKVWLPYYLTKGFLTSQKNQLIPIKVNPIF